MMERISRVMQTCVVREIVYAHVALLRKLLCVQDGGNTMEQMWVLKTTAHRGQGVSVVPQQQAVRAALTSSTGEDAATEMVQEYKGEQYMVAGRRFYLR